jgi:hypothetical protein
VRREPRRVAGGVALATAVLLVLLAFRPVATERLVAGYVLALAAIALAALTRLARPAAEQEPPSPFERALAEHGRRDERPPELVRAERELVLGQSSAAYAHRRLLPLLRECAAARLASAHAVDLERRPDRARALLGEETWELLRPDRPVPEDRHGPGVPRDRIERVVARLEAL